MNVGLISLIAKQKTGIDNYTQSLVENLIKIGKANNLYLIRYKENQDEIYTKTHEVTIPKIPFKLMNILHLYFRLPYAISKIDINVLHFPAHEHTQIIPFFLKPKIKKILTIHDLTPLLHPETHTKPTVLLWNSTLRLIKNKIDMILANSQNTKNDCIKYLNIPEEKIKVIYHACDEIYKPMDNKQEAREELDRKYNINSHFILYVGTLERRKNIPTLIKAFYKLKKAKMTHKLVIVGKKGWLYDDIFKIIEALNLRKDVI
ncbi:MAG: glycosyltransferase family 4 protein, partial [Candidatus Nanoarchaeia archaeon]